MAKRRGTRTITRYIGRKRRFHRPKMTLPLSIVAGFGVPVVSVIDSAMTGGARVGLTHACQIFTGYDPLTNKWNAGFLRFGLVPVLVGILVHKYIGGMLGVNRALARTGIPLIRL